MQPLIDFAQQHISPTPAQQDALLALGSFLNSPQRCFLLKGYAGTGKTFLTRIIAQYLKQCNIPVALMAPTGRAARVLSDKTGFIATTIHKAIYNLDHLDEIELRQNGKVKYKFKYLINENISVKGGVLLIDEASMISDRLSEQDFFVFGSGKLLTDLIDFARLKHIDSSTKIIFIGDPAQLPPVGDPVSGALSVEYLLDNFDIHAQAYELTNVVRQSAESKILDLATQIRQMMMATVRNSFRIGEAKEVERIEVDEVTRLFLESNPDLSYHKSIMINHSNRSALDFNLDLRRARFADKYQIEPGDTLMIVQNNYNYEIKLFNGTLVKVLEVDPNPEIKAGMLSYNHNGDECRVTCRFRRLVIEAPGNSKQLVPIECMILEDFLYSPEPSPPYSQNVALYLDFKMRKPHLKPKTKPFADELRRDPYFNALKVKYGYAVTCHKAQGGEWEEVFLNLDVGMGALTDAFLRWVYTAVTRASRKLYVFNVPVKHQFSGLKYTHLLIQEKEQTPQGNQPVVVTDNNGYLAILEKFNLGETPKFRNDKLFELWAIASHNGYEILKHTKENWCDIYGFAKDGNSAGLKFWFNGKNQFTRIEIFMPWTNNNEMAGTLSKLFGKPANIQIIGEVEATSSNDNEIDTEVNSEDSFDNFFEVDHTSHLKPLCNALLPGLTERGIGIKNIVHEGYLEKYYFVRKTENALIRFWYNNNFSFTRAMPDLQKCNSNALLNDLNEIINHLKTENYE